MQERELFHKICLNLTELNHQIIFVGIVDDYGRLLAGREGIPSLMNEFQIRVCDIGKILPFFLLNHVIEAIGDINASSGKDYVNTYRTIQIRIFEFDVTVLLVIPITDNGDRFLCIYIDGNYLSDDLLTKLIQNRSRW